MDLEPFMRYLKWIILFLILIGGLYFLFTKLGVEV
jgi:cbb3-type cytochrome oxidase subunit 3